MVVPSFFGAPARARKTENKSPALPILHPYLAALRLIFIYGVYTCIFFYI